ncbi:MAG: D-arabinono-1,4-lactone oxidase, partial [Mycobacteriales bacterium]
MVADTQALGERWSNWAGNQTARPRTVVHPQGVEEIAAAVRAAADSGRTVKPIGTGHSFTGVGVPNDVQMRLDRHAGLTSADPATGLVTVDAGMSIHDLSLALAERGLALTNLGDIDVQTISGALSTGTHGTGLGYGGLATQVRGLTIVLADGSVVHADDTENSDLYAAARVGLGAFGVIASYTLQAVPAFGLHAVEEPSTFEELVDDGRFAELAETVDHTEFYWFPHTHGCLLKRNTRVGLDELDPLPRWKAWRDDELLSNTVFGLTCAMGKAMPALIPRINRMASKALGRREFTAASHEVFASSRRVRFVEMEYNLPRAELTGVLRELRGFLDSAGLEISFPVEVRVAAPDDIWLSTAYERESAYVAVHVVRGSAYDRYFHGVEKIMGQVGGRPHWGKMHFLDAVALRERYPRFTDALA